MSDVRLDSLKQAIAAATHARMLMFKERSLDEIGDDLRGLSELTDPDELEAVHEAAVELLAMLDPDELQRLGAMVRDRRAVESVG